MTSTDGKLDRASSVLLHLDMEKHDNEAPVKTEGDHISEAKLVRKIDGRVLPVLCAITLLSFLDRVNISNAVIFGLREDLNLGGNQFNTALVVFFVPYILFEIPSNALLKHFKPHVWLTLCMSLYGLITLLQGFTQNFAGLVATRFFLGLAECGSVPATYYIVAMWYTRAEAQKRYSFMFSSSSLAGAFGGLLASAIGKMDGVGGYRGWRWVFIIEGTVTVVASFVLFFVASDFPEEAGWLSPAEKELVRVRLYDDVGSSKRYDPLTPARAFEIIKDWRIIIPGFMYLGLVTSGYCYAYFSPTIIRTLGYSPIETQLLSVPPWAFAFMLSMGTAAASDRLQMRYVFVLGLGALALAGFVILLVVHDNKPLQYAALFLAVGGNFSAMPIIVCWPNMNVGGHHRRAVSAAFQPGFSNIGGVVSAYAFLQKDAPKYIPGYSVAVAFVVLALVSSTAYYLGVARENRRREAMRAKGAHVHMSEEEKKEMGDLNPDYRYFT
ncbi:MFS general substrate transporter [Earliella scabrosa]|nr:MFS general substrate transporter [Earliella scabrosa]